jgi:hypothetical protein
MAAPAASTTTPARLSPGGSSKSTCTGASVDSWTSRFVTRANPGATADTRTTPRLGA